MWAGDDKYRLNRAYAVSNMAEDIMTELLSGPVEVTMDVYADFTAYKSGVYRHVAGDFMGKHAVKMFGWGTLQGTPYWWVQNSWGADWGDSGYFRIAQGECNIEEEATSGTW